MLFFVSIDLIVVVVLEIVLGGMNVRKDEGFFDDEEKGVGGRGEGEEGETFGELQQPLGFSYEKRERGKYSLDGKPETAEIEPRDKRERISEKVKESEGEDEFVEAFDEGLKAAPNNFNTPPLHQVNPRKTSNSYEHLSERSQIPSERSMISETPRPADNLNYLSVNRTYNNNSVSMEKKGEPKEHGTTPPQN